MTDLAPKIHTMYNQGNGTWATFEAPPPSAWRGNEPSGMTSGAFSNRIFGTQTDSGSGWFGAGVNPMSIVATDSEYDDGNGLAGRVVYPVGWAGGDDAPSATGYSWAGAREIYLCHDWLCSANWQPHPTGTNKIIYMTNSGGNPAFTSYETDQETPQIQIRNQGMAVYVPTPPNLATVEVSSGELLLIEVHLISNSAAGVADGEAHLWINGVKTTQYTGLEWNASNFTFNQVLWNPIWGGGGSTVINEMYQQISRLYLSYKS